jgi:hypothetical protein
MGQVRTAICLAVAAAAAGAAEANASELIDRNARNASLAVDGSGHALVTYSARGGTRRVHAWGAINARPPTRGVPQVSFRLNYRGSGFRGGSCLPYDGPPLAWLVRACKAPDGSYWALQAWERLKANFGGASGARELRLSHWTGPLPRLWLKFDWAYRQHFDHLYGAFTYGGGGVFGFRSAGSGNPLDSYGRNVYVDTFDSRYGSGWRRENGFLTHRPNGSFCYGFYPHGNHPAGRGTRYRATAIGPGVTPDVTAEGPAPGPYHAGREQAANDEQRRLFAGSPPCRAR